MKGIKLFLWPNCSCASYAASFSVNIQLAQTRLNRKFASRSFLLIDGVFNAVHYFCTEAKRDRFTTPNLHANVLTQHIHTHIYWIKPCCKGKMAAQRILCFSVWFIVQTEWCCFSQSMRSLLGSLGVALHTQDPAVQWVAAVFICFYGEGPSTVLENKYILSQTCFFFFLKRGERYTQ